jgi:hypothetical protein
LVTFILIPTDAEAAQSVIGRFHRLLAGDEVLPSMTSWPIGAIAVPELVSTTHMPGHIVSCIAYGIPARSEDVGTLIIQSRAKTVPDKVLSLKNGVHYSLNEALGVVDLLYREGAARVLLTLRMKRPPKEER